MASSPTGVENSERASQVLLEGLRLIRTYVSRRPWVFGTAVFGGFVYSIMLVVGTEVLGEATDRVLIPAFEDRAPDGSQRWLLASIVVVALLRWRFDGCWSERVMKVALSQQGCERLSHFRNGCAA